MASHSNDTETISEAMDYAEHQKTWSFFTGLVKWGIISCAILVLALYVLINP